MIPSGAQRPIRTVSPRLFCLAYPICAPPPPPHTTTEEQVKSTFCKIENVNVLQVRRLYVRGTQCIYYIMQVNIYFYIIQVYTVHARHSRMKLPDKLCAFDGGEMSLYYINIYIYIPTRKVSPPTFIVCAICFLKNKN